VVPSLWSPQISHLIKLAAEDVTRIFVNPAIKQQLCLDAGNDRAWLRKSDRGSSIVRICTFVCAARRVAWSEEQAPPPPAMAAALSYKAGLNHRNPEQPPCEEDAASAAAFLPGATG
jgi:penicillin-insensitive murein endopeptidase